MSTSFRLSKLLPRFLRGDRGKNSINRENGPNGERLKDGQSCKILFLDDTEVVVGFKGGAKGNYLLDRVFDHLNLVEKDYFGLRYLDTSEQAHWLDIHKSLSSQLKTCCVPYQMYFGVKFYPVDPCKLKEEITRYQFFLQVKKDIEQGRLPVTFEEGVELCAYAVQSELGDYDPTKHGLGYVSEFRFVPNQTEELEDNIAAIHRRLGGLAPADAEYKFLDKVKWMDMYGVDLHPVMGEGNTEYFLGLTPMGIVVYRNKTKVGNYFWPRISKVTFKGKIFIIKVRDKNNDEHTYAFEVVTKLGCKHLWKCCVEHHAFFRLRQVNDSYARSDIQYKSTSRKSRSGRHERLAQTEYSRQQPSVMRAPSKRHPRRTNSDSRINAHLDRTSYVSGISITRLDPPTSHKRSRGTRSLPDLQNSPKSTRSAPWESNVDAGLYTSGRDSPLSMYSDGVKFSRRAGPGSDTESAYSRKKYFPSRKGSDNESDVSFSRRRRREMDSGSESDFPHSRGGGRRPKSTNEDWFERQWDTAMQQYVPNKESHMNGSVPSLHSAPAGEAAKRRRRRRSKSPSTSKRPPEELRQHFEYGLVETTGMTEEELRDIPYIKVETKGEPFRVKYSPKTRQRYRSPKRKSTGDIETNMRGGGFLSGPDEPPPPYRPAGVVTPESQRRNYYSDTNSRNDANNNIHRPPHSRIKPPPLDNSSLNSHDTLLSVRTQKSHDTMLSAPSQRSHDTMLSIRSQKSHNDTMISVHSERSHDSMLSVPSRNKNSALNSEQGYGNIKDGNRSQLDTGRFDNRSENTRIMYKTEHRDKINPVWGERSPSRSDHKMDNRPETPKRLERDDVNRDQPLNFQREENKPKTVQYQLRSTPQNDNQLLESLPIGEGQVDLQESSSEETTPRGDETTPREEEMEEVRQNEEDEVFQEEGSRHVKQTLPSMQRNQPLMNSNSVGTSTSNYSQGNDYKSRSGYSPVKQRFTTPVMDKYTPVHNEYASVVKDRLFPPTKEAYSINVRDGYTSTQGFSSPLTNKHSANVGLDIYSTPVKNTDKSRDYPTSQSTPSSRPLPLPPDSTHSMSRGTTANSRTFGTTEAIRKLYSSPSNNQRVYATQDSIQRIYNYQGDKMSPSKQVNNTPQQISHVGVSTNYRASPSLQQNSRHLTSPINPHQSMNSSRGATYNMIDNSRGVTHNVIDTSVIPRTIREPGQHHDLWTEI